MLGNLAIFGVLERHSVMSSLTPFLYERYLFFCLFFPLKKSITNKQLLNMLVKTAHNFYGTELVSETESKKRWH